MGNLTGVLEQGGGAVAFGYDALYRLTAEQRTGANAYSHAYGYDLAGNRTNVDSKVYAFDAANKYTNNAHATATYDGDGNLTSLTGTGLTYRGTLWNHAGMLTKFLNQNGTSASQQAYDALGTRVWTQVPGGPSVHYVYDGDTIIGEVVKTTTSSYIGAVYTWGADGLVSSRLTPNSSPKSLWYHYGPQGETRQLTNSAAAIVDTYLYDAYGVTLATTGTDYNPFRYGGQFGYYTLPTLGVINCGARWYDPQQGRWFSRDPIGYAGGENLYEYCGGDPANWTDTDGFAVESIKSAAERYRRRFRPTYGEKLWDNFVGNRHREDESALVRFINDGLSLPGVGPVGGGGLIGMARARRALVPAKPAVQIMGPFSIRDWSGYPAGMPKPTGPFQIRDGEVYELIRRAANAANARLKRKYPEFKGFDIHEWHPIKFGGSPTDLGNKYPLSRKDHAKLTTWWNRYLRRLKSGCE